MLIFKKKNLKLAWGRGKLLKEMLDITSYPPYIYALSYLANVAFFGVIYLLFFKDDFKTGALSLVQSVYFSVVTVTTLGFGDITPRLDVTSLLVTITAQVVIGVINIGLFLNGISHKLSDRKEQARDAHDKKVKEQELAKLLIILKPTVEAYLTVLADTYKVTCKLKDGIEGGIVNYKPKKLFDHNYFDQISTQDFFPIRLDMAQTLCFGGNLL